MSQEVGNAIDSMEVAELETERLPLSDVSPHPDNPRIHSPEQIKAIEQSLIMDGYIAGSMAIQRSTRTLYKGHGVYEALVNLGCVEADFVVMDLTDIETLALLARDNALSDMSTNDFPKLKAIEVKLEEMDVPIERMGQTMESMKELESEWAKSESDNRVIVEDDPPEVSEDEPITQTGDLWHLGSHRVLCGDSTKAEDVERVMGGEKADMVFTDPPYNVQVDYGVHEDDLPDDEWESFTLAWYNICREVSDQVLFTPGTGRGLGHPNFQLWYKIAPPDWMICWIKKNAVVHSSLGGFNNWEPIFFYGAPKKKVPQDIYDIPITVQVDVADQSGNKLHPTPKQVKLWGAIIGDFTEGGDTIFDPFLGSGTTLIAADQLDRVCYGLEIAPKYCDVIVQRYMNHRESADGVWVERGTDRITWEQITRSVKVI
jgi:DNA modification methylase